MRNKAVLARGVRAVMLNVFQALNVGGREAAPLRKSAARIAIMETLQEFSACERAPG
jgi:hypothetical protein